MEIELECKSCHTPRYRLLSDLRDDPTARCERCGWTRDLTPLLEAVDALAAQMAELRDVVRFDVGLFTDDLPAPHGFDEDYTLPEDAE